MSLSFTLTVQYILSLFLAGYLITVQLNIQVKVKLEPINRMLS